MAVTKDYTTYAVKIEYKPSYDTSGNLDLTAYSQIFSHVSESATVDQLKAFADALMSLTVYANAPYRVSLVDTSELVVA